MIFILSFGIERRFWTSICVSWSYLSGVLYRWPIFFYIIPLLICYASNARYQCICSVKICQNNTSSDWINYQQPNQIITKQEQNVSNEREILYSLVNAFPIDIIFDTPYYIRYLDTKMEDVYLMNFCKQLLTDDIIFYLTYVRIKVTDNWLTVHIIECDNYTT